VANLDLQNRAPSVTRLPDFRQRVERRYDVLNFIPKDPAKILAECWLPLGTTDVAYTNCYLIDQRVEGIGGGHSHGNYYEPNKFPPVLLRTFEELSPTGETQVGQPGVELDQYNNRIVTIDYLQLNVGTSTYQIPGTTPAPSPFSDCILKTEERKNDGTLMRIHRTYISSGQLTQTDDIKFGGKVLVRSVSSIGVEPVTPVGWTVITQNVEFVNGLKVYRYEFVLGDGLIEEAINSRQDGLREVTDISFGTKVIPAGVVIRDEYRESDGYKIYTVTSIQSDSGSAPTSGSYSVQRIVDFPYPGRAKLFTETYNSRTSLDIYMSPPVQMRVVATISVSYQNTNTFSVPSDLWAPKDWAVSRSQWISFGNNPHNKVEALHGYLFIGSSSATVTASNVAPIDAAIFGNPIYGGSTAKITLSGGPTDPAGTTKTLEAYLDERPAFISVTGTKYYRLTTVSIEIPTPPSLPV